MKQVFPQWQESHVETDVTEARVGFEDRTDREIRESEQHGIASKSQRQRYDVQQSNVYLKRRYEEPSKVLEHLSEEVPVESDVRSQIGNRQNETDRISDKTPAVHYSVGSIEQTRQNGAKHRRHFSDNGQSASTRSFASHINRRWHHQRHRIQSLKG